MRFAFSPAAATEYAGRVPSGGSLDGRFALRAWIHFAVLVLMLGTLVAQTPIGTPDVCGSINSSTAVKQLISPPVSGPPVVINAPYSAEMISTFDKVRSNGEHVHRETHERVFRDSQGRRRIEADAVGTSGTEPKAVLVLIIDPVEGRNIKLDSCTMTARVYTRQPETKRATASGAPPPGDSAKTASSASSSAMPTAAQDSTTGAAPGNGPIGGAVPKKSDTSEELGTREMEGLTVSGTKSILVANGPATGDGQPNAVTTIVQWEARDIGIVVLKDNDDAELGHIVTRLEHIVRTEPDPALFQIPSGYTVTENRPQTKGQD